MSIAYPEIHTLPQVELRGRRRRQTTTGVLRSLIVSPHAGRLGMLEHAAADGGWNPTISRSVEQAAAYLERFRWQLLVLDVDSERTQIPLEGGRELAERFAGGGEPLLMICGQEGDPLEEIWARQLGVWLYLPGVDETCDLIMPYREARKVAEKRSQAAVFS